MLKKLKSKINEELSSHNIIVDDIFFNEVENTLNVVLDKEEGIDLNQVVDASRIINKIIDEEDLPYKNYVVDIYSKERGI